jgi:hypothetical protein
MDAYVTAQAAARAVPVMQLVGRHIPLHLLDCVLRTHAGTGMTCNAACMIDPHVPWQ